MELIAHLIPLLLTLSLAGLVLTVGLNAEKGDFVYVMERPGMLARAVLAVLIIPPIAAGLLLWLLPVDPLVKAGIMLMAVAPVPPLVPGKELAVGAHKNYAYGVYIAMALLTVVSVPLVFDLASRLYGRHDVVTVATMAGAVLTGVLIPLALGILVRRFAPGFASRAAPWMYKLSMLLIVIAFVPILIKVWGPMMHLIGNGTVAVMAAMTLICIASGHMLGGPELVNRATLAVTASVRHPGIAMALASANMADPRVTAAILLFMVTGMIASVPYTMWIKRSLRHDQHPASL